MRQESFPAMHRALGDREAVQLQVRIEAPDDSGRRAIAIYSRRQDATAEGEDMAGSKQSSASG